MVQRKRTYTWDTLLPGSGGTGSKKISSKVFNDYDIVITLDDTGTIMFQRGTEYEEDTFDITIARANPTAVEADILLSLTNIKEEKKSLTNWGVSPCIFSNWSLPPDLSHKKTYNFVCQITWMITDPIPRPHIDLNHMKKFLMSLSYCDVKIIIGTGELPAHKVVLASRSNVFDAMFSAPMKEAADNKIIVEDIRLDVMKAVLAFLYSGEEEALDDPQIALGCLAAAGKYEIQDLKELCEYKLCKYITVENVIAIFSDADTLGADKLKRECLIFIAENRAKIIPTIEFQEMLAAKPHSIVHLMEILIPDS